MQSRGKAAQYLLYHWAWLWLLWRFGWGRSSGAVRGRLTCWASILNLALPTHINALETPQAERSNHDVEQIHLGQTICDMWRWYTTIPYRFMHCASTFYDASQACFRLRLHLIHLVLEGRLKTMRAAGWLTMQLV